MPDVVIDPRGVRPVALDGDKGEPFPLDQLARNSRPHAIELGRAVRRLAEKHDPRVADPPQQRCQVRGIDRIEPLA